MNFCRKQFRNKSMKKSLLNAENIPKLEDILHENMQQFKRLERLKHHSKRKFAEKVDANELDEVAFRVYMEVNKFLGFKPCNLPTVLHALRSSFEYIPESKTITIETLQRVTLIPGIAHEYAHFMQDSKRLWHDCYDIFLEGHAMGVERHIAESYMKKEDNELFLCDVTEETVHDIARGYRWVCRKLGKKPRDSLSKLNVSGLKILSSRYSSYALGTALFSIYGAEYGKEIYKKALKCK